MQKPATKNKDKPKPIRQGLITLSLGVDVLAQLGELWRDYTLVSGLRAASRSEAVRDMIARAHRDFRPRRKR